jgi:hypothetical protein
MVNHRVPRQHPVDQRGDPDVVAVALAPGDPAQRITAIARFRLHEK